MTLSIFGIAGRSSVPAGWVCSATSYGEVGNTRKIPDILFPDGLSWLMLPAPSEERNRKDLSSLRFSQLCWLVDSKTVIEVRVREVRDLQVPVIVEDIIGQAGRGLRLE